MPGAYHDPPLHSSSLLCKPQAAGRPPIMTSAPHTGGAFFKGQAVPCCPPVANPAFSPLPIQDEPSSKATGSPLIPSGDVWVSKGVEAGTKTNGTASPASKGAAATANVKKHATIGHVRGVRDTSGLLPCWYLPCSGAGHQTLAQHKVIWIRPARQLLFAFFPLHPTSSCR